jgi:hypothetical protein
MNSRRAFSFLVLSCCFLMPCSLLLTGCGAGSSGKVEISPRSVTLSPGGTQQFSVTVTNCPNTAVDWDAFGGSISDAGVYTAPSEPGSYTVTAECDDDSTINDSVTVTVE